MVAKHKTLLLSLPLDAHKTVDLSLTRLFANNWIHYSPTRQSMATSTQLSVQEPQKLRDCFLDAISKIVLFSNCCSTERDKNYLLTSGCFEIVFSSSIETYMTSLVHCDFVFFVSKWHP